MVNTLKSLLIPFSLYKQLTKPKQTFLLLYTGIFAYLISAWGYNFNIFDLFWLIVGQFLAISGATMINMYWDRDIDAQMERTKQRPLPMKQVIPFTVLIYGVLSVVVGILITGLFLNFLTMVIGILGAFFDIVVYTILLKRRSRWSIVLGGIAGGLPAVGGRAAALGTLDLISLLLLFFVLCWIPVHNLSLALIPKTLKGYKDAQIPVLSLESGLSQTMRIIAFSAILTAIVIIMSALLLAIHPIILLIMIIFSLYLIYLSIGNLWRPSDTKTFKIFKFASMYMGLAFLFLFIGVVINNAL
ncbi:MAG: heme o synthase [Promethearchaeota archaeon]